MKTTEEKARPVLRRPPKLPTLRLVYSGDDAVLPAAVFHPARDGAPIGREVQNGISLPADPRASRHHATLHAAVTGSLRVVDERSRNGTLVNGKRVEQVLLRDGDTLTIGDSHFIVRAEPDDP